MGSNPVIGAEAKRVLTGSEDCCIRIWNLFNGRGLPFEVAEMLFESHLGVCTGILKGHEQRISCLHATGSPIVQAVFVVCLKQLCRRHWCQWWR